VLHNLVTILYKTPNIQSTTKYC